MHDQRQGQPKQSQAEPSRNIIADGPSDLKEVTAHLYEPVGCATLIHLLAAGFLILALHLEWITPALAVALLVVYVAGVWLIRRTIRRMFETPFAMKARALRDATAEVHRITRLETPPAGWETFQEGGGEALVWYTIEAAMTPKPQATGFQAWEPAELCLVDATAAVEHLEDIEGEFPVTDVFTERDGQFVPDDGGKLEGPQTIRFSVGLPPQLRQAQFLYYTETFGSVTLPQ